MYLSIFEKGFLPEVGYVWKVIFITRRSEIGGEFGPVREEADGRIEFIEGQGIGYG